MKTYLLELLARFILKINYSIEVNGLEKKSKNKSYLLLPQHISYFDALWVGATVYPRIHFLIYKDFYNAKLSGIYPRAFDAIPISRLRAKDALVKSISYLKKGKPVCIFPEGMLTCTGTINPLQKGMMLIKKKSNIDSILVQTSGFWGTLVSKKDTKHKIRFKHLFRKKIFIEMDIIKADNVDDFKQSLDEVDTKMRELSYLALNKHAEYLSSIYYKYFFKPIFFIKCFRTLAYLTSDKNIILYKEKDILNFFDLKSFNKTAKSENKFINNFSSIFHRETIERNCFEFLKIHQTNLLNVNYSSDSKNSSANNIFDYDIEISANPSFWDNNYAVILILLFLLKEKKKVIIKEVESMPKNLTKIKIGRSNKSPIHRNDNKLDISNNSMKKNSNDNLYSSNSIESWEIQILAISKTSQIEEPSNYDLPTGILTDEDGFISLPLPEPLLSDQVRDNTERYYEPSYEPNTFGKLLNGVKINILEKYNLKKNDLNLIELAK